MYLCIGEHPEAKNYRLLDLGTLEVIPDVIWADDIKGSYCRYVRGTDGLHKRTEDGEGLETEILIGSIKLVKMTQCVQEARVPKAYRS